MFVKDLLIDPSTRGVSDVRHTVVAAASSRSSDQAGTFLEQMGCPSTARAYGSYAELVQDADVDIVYVATPHSHHYQNAMLCLEAGKHVLCEKPLTVNAAQARKLAQTARARGLFLMEAVWTRYFPLSVTLRRLIVDGEIGAVHRVVADLSFAEDVETKWGTQHRMVNMDLAGGCLLDRESPPLSAHSSLRLVSWALDLPISPYLVGLYSLTWVFQTLYHTLPASARKPPQVASMLSKYPATGADECTTVLLNFPAGPGCASYAHGVAMTSIRVATDPDGRASAGAAIRIQGSQGEIQVGPSAARPTRYRVLKKGQDPVEVEVEIPGKGHGMFWEADEAARCVRDRRLESEGLTWEESAVIMDVMDEVRRQGGLRYSDKLETTGYPVDL